MNKLTQFICRLRHCPAAFLMLALMTTSNQVLAEAADKNKPIDLEADSVKVDDAKQLSIYTGNVILTQGTLIIRAEKLIVQEDSQGFQHSTSLGTPNKPTTFKQKREGKNEYMEGSAQRIEYDGRMDKVQLYTRAWVKRGEDVVHGDYIMYDANAEYAEVIGGGNEGVDSITPKGRVRAVIQPKNKAEDTAPSAPIKREIMPAPSTAPTNNNNANSGASNTPTNPDTTQPNSATTKDPRFSRTLQLGADGQ